MLHSSIGLEIGKTVEKWLREKFEKYQIVDTMDQWSIDYISKRDNFLTELSGSPVSSCFRWNFYILRVERRLGYINAKHQPFRKLSGEDLVTLQVLRSTLMSLRISKVSNLYTKTALISNASVLTFASTGTSRAWVEALIQKGVIKELTDPAITGDKRRKYLFASAATRTEFYKNCVLEMLYHIHGVQTLFGQGSMQLEREVDLFVGYDILTKEEISQFLEEKKKLN